jgi:hypothetical protein
VRGSSWIERILWGVAGLAAGVCAGAVLAVIAVAGPAAAWGDVARGADFAWHLATGRRLPAQPGDLMAGAAWKVSLLYALGVGLVAFPIWVLIARLGRKMRVDAVVLGALLGGALGFAMEKADWAFTLRIAAVGAASGLLVWAVSHRWAKARR